MSKTRTLHQLGGGVRSSCISILACLHELHLVIKPVFVSFICSDISLVNVMPPQNVQAHNTSHTSIMVGWALYDNGKYWNSNTMKFRIYWKRTDLTLRSSQYNLLSWDYTDAHSTFKTFNELNYGPDVITSYEITGLESFTNYTILVATVNPAGVGAFAVTYCRSNRWCKYLVFYIGYIGSF